MYMNERKNVYVRNHTTKTFSYYSTYSHSPEEKTRTCLALKQDIVAMLEKNTLEIQ